MIVRRFESYKSDVVRPFFKDHFSRLDRQIVLVDVLGALNQGADALADLDRAMDDVLKVFRPGANSWWSLLLGTQNRKSSVRRHQGRSPSCPEPRPACSGSEAHRRGSHAAGRDAKVPARTRSPSRRCGRRAKSRSRAAAETSPCLKGMPLKGERVGDHRLRRAEEAAIFPGDLAGRSAGRARCRAHRQAASL